MWGSRELLLVWFLVLAAGGTEHVYRPGRRVCVVGVAEAPESFVQRVYQPFLTTCDGHRACSTYRTLYRTAYRRSPGPAPARPRYACCPGWKRSSGLPGACAAAVCQPPCRNGGSCVRPGRCRCPAGWRGDTCQTDVDECSSGRSGCPQRCVNTAGSYWCQCWEGHSPSADGRLCLPRGGAPSSAPSPPTAPCRPQGLEDTGRASLVMGHYYFRYALCHFKLVPGGRRREGGGAAAAGQGGRAGAEAAAGAGPAAQPGLAGLGARAAGPRQPPGPLLPAAGPRGLSERADLLPRGAAGVMLLQKGAVTGPARLPAPPSALQPAPLGVVFKTPRTRAWGGAPLLPTTPGASQGRCGKVRGLPAGGATGWGTHPQSFVRIKTRLDWWMELGPSRPGALCVHGGGGGMELQGSRAPGSHAQVRPQSQAGPACTWGHRADLRLLPCAPLDEAHPPEGAGCVCVYTGHHPGHSVSDHSEPRTSKSSFIKITETALTVSRPRPPAPVRPPESQPLPAWSGGCGLRTQGAPPPPAPSRPRTWCCCSCDGLGPWARGQSAPGPGPG